MNDQADYRFILEETLSELRERAERIQPNTAYEEGRLMAYYEILSEALNQARIVGLNEEDIGLKEFRADGLLKKARAA
jgi:hypothetical protein